MFKVGAFFFCISSEKMFHPALQLLGTLEFLHPKYSVQKQIANLKNGGGWRGEGKEVSE